MRKIYLILFVVLIFLTGCVNKKPDNINDVVITLERTACYGTCHAYKLTISGEGTVEYEGKQFVNVIGKQTDKISIGKVNELVNTFYNINYFSLKDNYYEPVTDLPTTTTSITINGKTKTVVDYVGAPQSLKDLENKIDEITNSKRWIKGE